MQKRSVRFLTQAAVIAALYAVLTIAVSLIPALNTLSFGPFQVRISEALTILPAFTPAAIPGLFVGCLASNLVGMATSGVTLLDVICGSLASLVAAWISYRVRKYPWLVPLAPVVVNAFVVAAVLKATLDLPYWLMVGTVGGGQVIACYGLGMLLYYALKRKPFDTLLG